MHPTNRISYRIKGRSLLIKLGERTIKPKFVRRRDTGFGADPGVIVGGILSDRWFQVNSRGRIYTGAIGLALTIPALFLMGYGFTVFHIIASAFLFGFGFGMFDTNNMPILCQFVQPNQRATGYGFLNTAGIFAGALITDYLGKSTDAGNLGKDFAMLAFVVVIVLIIQLLFLKPQKTIALS